MSESVTVGLPVTDCVATDDTVDDFSSDRVKLAEMEGVGEVVSELVTLRDFEGESVAEAASEGDTVTFGVGVSVFCRLSESDCERAHVSESDTLTVHERDTLFESEGTSEND